MFYISVQAWIYRGIWDGTGQCVGAEVHQDGRLFGETSAGGIKEEGEVWSVGQLVSKSVGQWFSDCTFFLPNERNVDENKCRVRIIGE